MKLVVRLKFGFVLLNFIRPYIKLFEFYVAVWARRISLAIL